MYSDLNILLIAVLCVLPVLLLAPGRWQPVLTLLWSLVLAAATVPVAVQVLSSGTTFETTVGTLPILGQVHFAIDGLSAFFILISNLTCVAGAAYGTGYLANHMKGAGIMRLHAMAYCLLQGAMVVLPMLSELPAFLVGWEIMTLSSLLLVLFDFEKEETVKTALNYLVQMHIGVGFLMIGYVVVHSATGANTFGDLAHYFSLNPNIPVFLLFMAGFGVKAGFVPMHSWLPKAHPAAPSHVSGVMSGGMIKLGIYGILRVVFQLQAEQETIGIIIATAGIGTALYGILQSTYQKDLKQALAYSSIENIGIIGLGIGLGLVGQASGTPLLGAFGYAGALLHVLNHACFKPLMFFTSGSVYQQTHTRDMNQLGGLMKRMPKTGTFFLIGAIAACALPPLGTFASEFLLYRSLLGGLEPQNLEFNVIVMLALVGLVLVGGLSLFSFSRMFGIGFLGTARTEKAELATEVGPIMWIPQAILACLLLGIGLAPTFVLSGLATPITQLIGSNVFQQFVTAEAEPLRMVGITSGILIAITAIIAALRAMQQRGVEIRTGGTWGCGYTAATPMIQYTATTYGDSIPRLVGPMAHRTVTYRGIDPNDIFPADRTYDVHPVDIVESTAVNSTVGGFKFFLEKIAVFQNGHIQQYILYAVVFLAILIVLTITQVI